MVRSFWRRGLDRQHINLLQKNQIFILSVQQNRKFEPNFRRLWYFQHDDIKKSLLLFLLYILSVFIFLNHDTAIRKFGTSRYFDRLRRWRIGNRHLMTKIHGRRWRQHVTGGVFGTHQTQFTILNTRSIWRKGITQRRKFSNSIFWWFNRKYRRGRQRTDVLYNWTESIGRYE